MALTKCPLKVNYCNCVNNFVRITYQLDVILPYLNSSVDSPIASQCATTRTTGGGDASIGDLLNEVSCKYIIQCILEPYLIGVYYLTCIDTIYRLDNIYD